MKKKRIIMLLLAVVLLILTVVSCTPADDTQSSDLGLYFKTYQKHDGWIYYCDLSSGQLCKIRSNGEEQTEIGDVKTISFAIYEDRIYYIDMGKERNICSIKMDGSQKTNIHEKMTSDWPLTKLDVYDGWVYFGN